MAAIAILDTTVTLNLDQVLYALEKMSNSITASDITDMQLKRLKLCYENASEIKKVSDVVNRMDKR